MAAGRGGACRLSGCEPAGAVAKPAACSDQHAARGSRAGGGLTVVQQVFRRVGGVGQQVGEAVTLRRQRLGQLVRHPKVAQLGDLGRLLARTLGPAALGCRHQRTAMPPPAGQRGMQSGLVGTAPPINGGQGGRREPCRERLEADPTLGAVQRLPPEQRGAEQPRPPCRGAP